MLTAIAFAAAELPVGDMPDSEGGGGVEGIDEAALPPLPPPMPPMPTIPVTPLPLLFVVGLLFLGAAAAATNPAATRA